VFTNWKTILLLAIPSIFSFATMTVTGTINLIIVGQLGAVLIAIVGVSNIIIYNIWALFSGIGHTVNYLVAQSYGAGEYRKVVERTYLALYLCLAVALIVCAVGTLFSGFLLRLITGMSDLAEIGEVYVRLRFYALALGIFSFVFHGFFRGIGDTRTPAYLTLLTCVIMIFLTYVLTYGVYGFPELGLEGAGWAFLIGELIGFLGCIYVYLIRLNKKYTTRANVSFHRNELKLITQESGKLGIQEFALSVSMFIFTMFVARLGQYALAANEIALNVMSFGFMPAFAFGATATILVGQQVGKGNPIEGRRLGTETAILGSIFLIIIGVLEYFFAEPIAKLYSPEPEIFLLVTRLIMISAFLQLFDGLLNFYAGGLRGIGDTSFLMRSSFFYGVIVFVPLSYFLIFVLDLGSIGAWLSLYTFLTLFALSVTIRYYRTDWLSVKLKNAEKED
jgi:MATE family multidrug resistance protein